MGVLHVAKFLSHYLCGESVLRLLQHGGSTDKSVTFHLAQSFSEASFSWFNNRFKVLLSITERKIADKAFWKLGKNDEEFLTIFSHLETPYVSSQQSIDYLQVTMKF